VAADGVVEEETSLLKCLKGWCTNKADLMKTKEEISPNGDRVVTNALRPIIEVGRPYVPRVLADDEAAELQRKPIRRYFIQIPGMVSATAVHGLTRWIV
jgi:hypothetical protein